MPVQDDAGLAQDAPVPVQDGAGLSQGAPTPVQDGSNLACRVAADAQGAAVLTRPDALAFTEAGTTYRVAADIGTGAAGAPVLMQITERSADGQVLGEASEQVTTALDAGRQPITVYYTATASGSALEVRLTASSLPAGGHLDVRAALDGPEPVQGYAGWAISWWDEFDGSDVDPAKWKVLHDSTYGWGNHELACMMREAVTVRDGSVRIAAAPRPESECESLGEHPGPRAYTSGHMNTRDRFTVRYGRIEMRARTPMVDGTSAGLFPAFWMRPADDSPGEIDVFEQIGSGIADGNSGTEGGTAGGSGSDGEPGADRTVLQTLHGSKDDSPKKVQCVPPYTAAEPTSTGFHVYGVEWDSGAIRWYVDDPANVTCTLTAADVPWFGYFSDPEKSPYYLRLNLAVGGDWPGSPDAATAFPATYEVDWVRVWERR